MRDVLGSALRAQRARRTSWGAISGRVIMPSEKPNGEAFDFAVFDEMQKRQEEGIDVPIRSPDGKETGLVIKVAGPDSKRWKNAIRQIRDEMLASETISTLTAEQVEDRNLRGLAMATISWNKLTLDGKDVPFSVDSAASFYRRFPFIKDQVEARANTRASFMVKSSASSSAPSKDASKG